SRYGTSITLTILNEITDKLYSKKGVFILFGSPYMGLFDIASKYGFKLEDWVDIVLNTIPNQGTKTVRTEEAVHATLTLLNIMI
ncbi:MAG: hypothetical protein J7K21_00255, partial [Desulfurococcales archaeon]|nr:hypothetical protein [Desulfurococcales archaeon]